MSKEQAGPFTLAYDVIGAKFCPWDGCRFLREVAVRRVDTGEVVHVCSAHAKILDEMSPLTKLPDDYVQPLERGPDYGEQGYGSNEPSINEDDVRAEIARKLNKGVTKVTAKHIADKVGTTSGKVRYMFENFEFMEMMESDNQNPQWIIKEK